MIKRARLVVTQTTIMPSSKRPAEMENIRKELLERKQCAKHSGWSTENVGGAK